MGLFSKKDDTLPPQQAPPTTYNNAPHGHHTTRHSADMSPNTGRSRRGFLSRRRSSSLSSSDEEMRRSGLHKGSRVSTSSEHGHHTGSRSGGGIGGMFSRNREMEDPSITQARERVQMAEQAETDAERALMHARESVQDARQHVKNLEVEAQEDARRAKLKQQSAKEIGKMGSKLGRKF